MKRGYDGKFTKEDTHETVTIPKDTYYRLLSTSYERHFLVIAISVFLEYKPDTVIKQARKGAELLIKEMTDSDLSESEMMASGILIIQGVIMNLLVAWDTRLKKRRVQG